MTVASNFVIAFILSFAGSVPPGSINLTVIQLGLENKIKIALRFSAAAAVMEYPYAWIAVKFQRLIVSSSAITENLVLITALVLILLGLISVLSTSKSSAVKPSALSNSGYRRGIILGIFNPLAIPYWVGITAYLESQRWTDLSSPLKLHLYLAGVVLGAFALLALLAYLSTKIMKSFNNYPWIRRIPGFLLLALGMYSLLQYSLNLNR